ncbi:MAG: VWA domain-containing protein [Saprospiraceae bacterium]|nr:VWA domain-containing protein [Saprospiraceae bacterium]
MEGMPKVNVSASRTFHQLGIFVLDGSGSMEEDAEGGVSKADAVNIAMRDLLTRFKVSKKRRNFSFAVVTFDTDAVVHTPITDADTIDDNGNYDPLTNHGGGTHIHEGLRIADQIATNFLSQASPGGVGHSVIILLMTDGLCQEPTESKQLADRIKKGPNAGKITICTTLFSQKGTSDQGAKDLLRIIASDHVMGFKEVYDAENLRAFFISSITAAASNLVVGTSSGNTFNI